MHVCLWHWYHLGLVLHQSALANISLMSTVGQEGVRGMASGRLASGLLRSGKGDRLEPDRVSSVCLLMEGAQAGGSGCPSFPGNQGNSVQCLSFTRRPDPTQGPCQCRPMPLKCSPPRGGHDLLGSDCGSHWRPPPSLLSCEMEPPDLVANLDGGTGMFLSLVRLRHETA